MIEHSLTPLFLLAIVAAFAKADCGSKGIFCVNSTTYQTCQTVLSMTTYSAQYYSCAEGTACDQETGTDNCVALPTTTEAATTAIASSTASTDATTTATDSCGSKAIHCFNETTYKSCFTFLFVFYTGDYVTCETGTVCDENEGTTNCISDGSLTRSLVRAVGNESIADSAVVPRASDQVDEKSLLIFDDTTTTTTARPDSCGSKGIHCFNDTTYKTCYTFFIVIYTGDYVDCDSGTVCNENNGTTKYLKLWIDLFGFS